MSRELKRWAFRATALRTSGLGASSRLAGKPRNILWRPSERSVDIALKPKTCAAQTSPPSDISMHRRVLLSERLDVVLKDHVCVLPANGVTQDLSIDNVALGRRARHLPVGCVYGTRCGVRGGPWSPRGRARDKRVDRGCWTFCVLVLSLFYGDRPGKMRRNRA